MATEEKSPQETVEEKPKAESEEVNNAGTNDAKDDKNKDASDTNEKKDEESSSDEEMLGIYDKPILVEGKRERKKTEFLVKDQETVKKEPTPMVFKGKGDRLGGMEIVNHELSKCTALELKPLHKLLFGREGKQTEIKKNIRNFNGFDFEKDSKEYENKKWGVERFTNDGLKRLLEILDLEKKGKRGEMKDRVIDFLMNPKASGRIVPEPKKKPAKKSKKSGKKRKRTDTKKKKEKVEEEEEDDEEEDDEDDDGDNDGDDEEDEPPKKKKKSEEKPKPKAKAKPKTPEKVKSPAKSKSAKKDAKKDTKKDAKKSPKKSKPVAVKITSGKKTPKKSPKKAAKAEDSSSDEEPLVKKIKKAPTEGEIAKVVKDLLKDADLKVVTVKSICKEVYAKYPGFDLSDKKSFIKETVYSIISSDAQ